MFQAETGFNLGPTNMPSQQTFSFGGGQGGSAFGQLQFAPEYRSFGDNSSFFRNSAISQTSGQASNQAPSGSSIADIANNVDSLNKLSNSSIFKDSGSEAAQQAGQSVDSVLDPGFYDKTFNLGIDTPTGIGEGSSGGGFFSGINDSINAFGADYLGFGTGSGAAGSLGTSATLGSTLGAAGLGFTAGGYLAGLVGGNSTGGSIGGAIGGAIGNAAIGTSLSTGLGTALGAAGSLLPGVGTVIGIAAGSLLGGLFGSKKKPNPAGGMRGVFVNPDGSLTGGTFKGKHLTQDKTQPVTNDFSKYLQKQAKDYGIQLDPRVRVDTVYDVNGFRGGNQLTPSITTGSGNYLINTYAQDEKGNTGLRTILYNSEDKKSKEAAYKEAFKNIVSLSGKNYDDLVKNKQAQSATGNIFNVQQQRTESAFDKFLKDYRGKQNANLA